MARPLKEGLDYFPMDTRFDEKIQALESVFKNDGLVWIIKFWQLAYRTDNGEVSLESYQGVIHAENSRVTPEKQSEILKLCLEIGLLVKMDNKKYTSNGIRKRFNHIIKDREKWRIEHKLPVIHRDNSRGSEVIHRDNPQETGESKVNKSKVKERIDKIRLVYTTLKNHSLTNYSSNDYARTGKAIVELINRAKDNDALVLEALAWIGEQKFEWTLETLNKKWVDFMAYKQSKPQVQKL